MDDADEILYKEEFVSNSRGMELFTCKWVRSDHQDRPKALIFLCHGFGMECSITMEGTATRLAKAGFAVYGLDYEGHGKSSGLRGYVPSFDKLVGDCSDHFSRICELSVNKGKKRFLLGESMGGAVVLLIHRNNPTYWNGAVLVAPMCKISDKMKPPAIVISILKKLAKVIPTWKIVPTKDLIESSFKTKERRDELRANPYLYKGRPRLRTANELLSASLDIEKNLLQVSLPFLTVHGGDDMVTDPSVSEVLHESACSRDKTLKIYDGMWHGLTSGEPPENIDHVFSDIIVWLDERT